MRTLPYLALSLALVSPARAQVDRFDAVVAAPGSHHILLEDEKVRVLRVEIQPGATEPVHDHRWPSIMYFEQPQPITYIQYKVIDGHAVEAKRFDAPAFKAGQTVRGEPEGLHAVLNRGTAPFRALRIEFKPDRPAAKP